MSDTSNPYQSPSANTEIVKPLDKQGVLTGTMLKHLSDASPWMRFIGIMGFIGAGLMVLGGLIPLIAAPFAARIDSDILGSASDYLPGILNGLSAILIIYALYVIGAGALMFFPAFFTYRFGAKIKEYTTSNSDQDLELAFRNNKSLWKFNGILMIVVLAFFPVMIIIGIVAVVAAMAIN